MLQASKTEIRYESSIGKEELTLKDKMAKKNPEFYPFLNWKRTRDHLVCTSFNK